MISVFVPAFNEEKKIEFTIQTIVTAAENAGRVALDIIVVDDASTDRTATLVDAITTRDPRVRAIHQPTNQGIGAGFLAALKVARYPKFMIVPGDNDVPVEMMTDMMSHHSQADLIIAYYLNKEDRGRRRNVLSTLYNMIYMVTFDVFIQYVNGPTIYSTEILQNLALKSRRFSIVSEANIKALRSGCTFGEVAGYMQTGLEGSTSFKLRNLIEVVLSFLRLIWEIHVLDRKKFCLKPRRVRLS
jgi:glycosyltransferase involved in cell wall biosynthesis